MAQAFADDIVIWLDGDDVEHMRRVSVELERLQTKESANQPQEDQVRDAQA